MRRAARVDANQAEVVRLLEQLGARVWIIREPVDLLVAFRGRWFPVECKDGNKPPSERQLTPQQREFVADACALNAPVLVVTSAEQAAAELLLRTSDSRKATR